MRVGAFDVQVLVDGEGTFATVGQTFPALDATEEWRLPVNAVLIRGAGTTVLVDTGFGVSHLHGPGLFSCCADGFSWSGLAKEGEAAVE